MMDMYYDSAFHFQLETCRDGGLDLTFRRSGENRHRVTSQITFLKPMLRTPSSFKCYSTDFVHNNYTAIDIGVT